MPLDIGVGILAALGVAHWFGTEPTVFLIIIGVLCALLPDIDILPVFWRTHYDHRSWLHYPLLYVPLGVLVYMVFGSMYAALFVVCVLAHLVHDTIGIGWGVAWLGPFSKRKFLFPEKGRRQRHGFFMTWTPKEEAKMAEEFHDPQWVSHYYFRPNAIAFVEYGALILALCAWLIL